MLNCPLVFALKVLFKKFSRSEWQWRWEVGEWEDKSHLNQPYYNIRIPFGDSGLGGIKMV